VSDAAAELGQDFGVDAVGLLQASAGAGELAGALGIDQRHRNAGQEQLDGQAAVKPARGLDDDQLDREGSELGDQRGDAVGIVGHLDLLADGIDEAVERRLGDVDADDDYVGHSDCGRGRIMLHVHGGFPALRMRTTTRGGVRPAVRVKYTRPPTIRLRDGVANASARSICRRPPRRGMLD